MRKRQNPGLHQKHQNTSKKRSSLLSQGNPRILEEKVKKSQIWSFWELLEIVRNHQKNGQKSENIVKITNLDQKVRIWPENPGIWREMGGRIGFFWFLGPI